MIRQEVINDAFVNRLFQEIPYIPNATIFSRSSLEILMELCSRTYHGYSTIYYSCDNNEDFWSSSSIVRQFTAKVYQGLTPYMNVISQYNSQIDMYKLRYDIEKTNTHSGHYSKNTSENNTSSKSEVSGGIDTYTNSDTTRVMTEDSPINATLGDIVTPNSKVNNSDNSTGNTTYGKTITHSDTGNKTHTDGGSDSFNDTETLKDPKLFGIYIELLEKYDIYNIFLKAFERIVYIKSAYI